MLMHVWIWQSGEPVHCDDIGMRPMRAINLANALISRGHSVTLWSSRFNHINHEFRNGNSSSVIEGLEIRLIDSPGYQKNLGLIRLFDHLVLAFNLRREIKYESKPDVAFIGYPQLKLLGY